MLSDLRYIKGGQRTEPDTQSKGIRPKDSFEWVTRTR